MSWVRVYDPFCCKAERRVKYARHMAQGPWWTMLYQWHSKQWCLSAIPFDNGRDKDCNQIGWVIVYISKGCWQHIRAKVEGVHIIWWQTCFCLQSTCKFSKKKLYSFHKILYSSSRVTKVSVHAPSSRMVLLCWQAGPGSIPTSGRNALRIDGNQINLDLRGMEAYVTRDGFK